MPQPHKGDRKLIATRIPRDLVTVVKARAEARELTVSEYLMALIQEDIGRGPRGGKPAVETATVTAAQGSNVVPIGRAAAALKAAAEALEAVASTAGEVERRVRDSNPR